MHRDSAYFEQETIWESELTDAERACVDLIERLWPADACTMLDAGAGAGRLLNNIIVNAAAVACDLSVTALKRIRAPSVAALATALPFPDRSFDLSLCSNVLEHLTEPDLARAFGELARISSKYVMIVSPIGEPIETQLTICGRCGCQFHPNGHRRRFNVSDFEDGLPEFLTETVSFFSEPFLTVSPLAAAAERALGRDIHHYAGAICPNCDWVAPLAGSPEPPGPALWDLGLQPHRTNPSDRYVPGSAIPNSAIVLLRRGRRVGGQRTPPAPMLRIAASERALPSVSLAARPPTKVDLCERVGALGPAILTGCVLLTPDSAWKPIADRPDLRLEGGPDDGYAIFCLPAEEVTASRELRLEVSGSLEPGIRIELHDTVLGYVGLGSIGPVAPARAGNRRTLAFDLPALPRPGGLNAVFRLFCPTGSIGGIEVHAIGIDPAPCPQARALTEEERAAGTIDLVDTLTWFGGPFAVRSEGGPITVRVDATALGCRSGSIDLGSGRSVTVPAWLAADHPASPPGNTATMRATVRLGHDVGLLFRRLRSFEKLAVEAGAAALTDALAAASGESPARIREFLKAVAAPGCADFADLDGRVASLTAHAEAIEARRASAERLLQERDRTITALQAQLAASLTHAEAIEARRAGTERLLQERDRTIAGLDGKLTMLGGQLEEREAELRAALNRLGN
jgi:hypothetical protein